MKDAIELTREALDLFEGYVKDGRGLEEIRVLGEAVASMAYTKQIYDRQTKKPDAPREFE
jgi:hypothetical protein